jgi:hypothetical protein
MMMIAVATTAAAVVVVVEVVVSIVLILNKTQHCTAENNVQPVIIFQLLNWPVSILV